MDESHPIPKLDVIDIHARRRSGGSDLVIIVASALSADARSVFRLFRKLDSYLREIDSDAYRQEFGEANPESTGIFSNYILKPGADPTIPAGCASRQSIVPRIGKTRTVKPYSACFSK